MEWLLGQFPDLEFTVEAIVAEDDLVVCPSPRNGLEPGPLNGFLPASGKSFSYAQSHWFRVVDGKLAEHWAVRDDLTAMLQLGVVSPPRLGALARQLRGAVRHRLGHDLALAGELASLCSSRTGRTRLAPKGRQKRDHMLKDLSGVGELQAALATTNALLTDVLAELKETNSRRLDEIARELRSLNEKVGKLPFTG